MSPDFYFFQASFRSHLNHPYPRAERKFRKGASLFSGFAQDGRSPDKCSVYKRSGRGTSPAKDNPSPAGRNIPRMETSPPKNKIPLSGRILSQERPSLLGQIERLTHSRKSTVFPVLGKYRFAAEAPLSPRFQILHLPAGTFRSDARRKPFPFDAPFAADGDMATVTWSNLLERLKRMGCGVNFKADA